MNSTISPILFKSANGPFGDPAFLITPAQWETSLLFDCGNLQHLKPRDLQRIRWLFLSHLHIDHFIGFDQLLRARLFSDIPLTVYGPQGTTRTLAHRLQGYAWNLTSDSPFVVRSFDLHTSEPISGLEFSCSHGFQPVVLKSDSESPSADHSIELAKGATVQSHLVEHGVACLCYRLNLINPPKFSLEKAQELGLNPGPWVRELILGQPITMEVQGATRSQNWLSKELLALPACSSLGYLTDTQITPPLAEHLARFFHRVDLLLSECAYLKEEAELAAQHLHMTTENVGTLAKRSLTKKLWLFHLSRRHLKNGGGAHLNQVRAIFDSTDLVDPKL